MGRVEKIIYIARERGNNRFRQTFLCDSISVVYAYFSVSLIYKYTSNCKLFPDYLREAKKLDKGQLVTISLSHYNELARLKKSGTEFSEMGFAPFAHILPSPNAHTGQGIVKKISTSKRKNVTCTPVL